MKFNIGDVMLDNNLPCLIVSDTESLRSAGSVTYNWSTTVLLTLPELLALLSDMGQKCRLICRDTSSLRTGDIIWLNNKIGMINTDNSVVPMALMQDGTEHLCSEACMQVVIFRENLLFLINKLIKKYGNDIKNINIAKEDVYGLFLLRDEVK